MLFERLLLLIYAYGTGIRAAAAGDHPHTEDDLRYARRRYLTVEACPAGRPDHRQRHLPRPADALWGEGTTAVASDSTTSPPSTSPPSTRTSSPSGTLATAGPGAVS